MTLRDLTVGSASYLSGSYYSMLERSWTGLVLSSWTSNLEILLKNEESCLAQAKDQGHSKLSRRFNSGSTAESSNPLEARRRWLLSAAPSTSADLLTRRLKVIHIPKGAVLRTSHVDTKICHNYWLQGQCAKNWCSKIFLFQH